jgi:hypothetical protein
MGGADMGAYGCVKRWGGGAWAGAGVCIALWGKWVSNAKSDPPPPPTS